ncbi:DUF7716 domain-containing protein [Burkholderia seminalis]|uniref:DUF7716 domain-containing protein n=1 Tax=Burkholderia seminalis TaxID=488731 RepID=UPI00158C2BA6|nr:hypothetical protein [Burkholderia seminalis]MBJ9968580.1 hypothetical protein [Burkholderia seminalis]MDN7591193.1 hypothetical protein [Burkholderia seminalis]
MDSDNAVSLRSILEEPTSFSGWLYLPPPPWTLETQGVFAPYTKDADDSNIPEIAKRHSWSITLDSDAIEDIVDNTSDQIENPTVDQLFEAFVFYFTNDAFIDWSR